LIPDRLSSADSAAPRSRRFLNAGEYIVTAEDLQRGTEGALRRRCDRCDHDMAFLMEIMNVTTPGRTRLFECQNCEKMAFVPA
jgi:hypothetical protein